MILFDALRNFAIIAAVERTEKNTNGFDLGKKLDTDLDVKLGDKTSNRLGRGALTNFIFEIIEGVWWQDPKGLDERIASWLIAREVKNSE